MVAVSWALGLGLVCIGCGGEPCADVANLLRQCCAKGPESLRASCEAEAKQLEADGNSKACQAELDRGSYQGCAR
jgi:hypothetical protein